MDSFAATAMLSVLLNLLLISSRVFLGLAVYNDAMARHLNSAMMWAIFSGIFGPIPAIIYLLVIRPESNNNMLCPRCGRKIPLGFQICPICKAPIEPGAVFDTPEMQSRRKKAKLFLIIAIVTFALYIVSSIAFLVLMLTSNVGNGVSYNFRLNLL